MDLRTRLAQLDRMTRKPVAASGASGSPRRPDKHHVQALCADLGLEPLQTGTCGVYVRRHSFPLPCPAFTGQDLAGLFSFDPDSSLEAADLLFLDVETTGLSGGTGTLAFLVGLAWWEDGQFVVEQVFLTDPDSEKGLLNRISLVAQGRKAVVTYNGASFDLPLLRTRALVNGQRGFLSKLVSLDLVVPARRFWRRSLPDCRQQTLETLICNVARGPGDIEGRDIPAVWFAFLRGEEDPRMASVLTHNERDMQGMARVWTALLEWADFADGRMDPQDRKRLQAWPQAWSLARVSHFRGQFPMVIHWLEITLDMVEQTAPAARPDAAVPSGFWRDAIMLTKRRRNWELLERTIAMGLTQCENAAWLHREAAIFYEYRRGKLDQALGHAIQCGEKHRVARLQGRLERLATNRRL